MIKKTLLFLPLSLLFVACSTNEIPNKASNQVSDSNDIIISYDEYKRLYENPVKQKIKKPKKEKIAYEPIITPEEYKAITNETNEPSLLDEEINSAFMDFYNEWKDVRYKFGGNSKNGIDCSAFTQRVFKEKFDISIPRSTRTQVNTGVEIKRSELELGDLVFFKTGKQDRHVGIYMGDGSFMHASIKGIKFTKLDKPFYKKAYWTSRRVIE